MRRLAVLLVLVATMILPMGQVLAEGTITVDSQSYDNHFPKDVTFHLKAEASQDITKITLDYKLNSGPNSAYAYPTFTPGRSVQADYSLPTNGNHYVVPGSDIEYYYEIEDAGGGKLKTEPARLTYEDTRFTWQKLQADGVTVYWYTQEQAARQVFQTAQATLAKMKSEAGEALENPVKVYVYGTKPEMDVALPFQSQASTQELVTEGEAFPEADEVMILASEPDLQGTTAHELTHLITHQLSKSAFGGIPAWLDEGLSMYAEGQLPSGNQRALDQAIQTNTLLGLRTISSMPGKPDLVNLFYGEAQSVVRYLISNYGSGKMSELLASFKQGTDINGALVQVYGFDLNALEAQWRASIGAAPASNNDSSGPVPPKAQNLPTLVPFGSDQPQAPSAGQTAAGQASNQSPLALYASLGAAIVVLLATGVIGVIFLKANRANRGA